MATRHVISCFATLLLASSVAWVAWSDLVEEAISKPGRLASDLERDVRSKPEAIIPPLNLKPGDRVVGRMRVEGEWPFSRMLIVRFESKEAFGAWYGSTEYQRLLQHRLKASTGNIVLLEGLPTFSPSLAQQT